MTLSFMRQQSVLFTSESVTESGGGAPGFDPEYSLLQLDDASRLYVESGDRRALRLANLLVNALLPRVDADWALDTSGGTRRPQEGRGHRACRRLSRPIGAPRP